MTIQTEGIEQARKASSIDFMEFSEQTKGKGFLNIINSASGWALVGPSGLFQDDEGNSFFTTTSVLHEHISRWGFKHFFQEGAFYVFLE